MNRMTWLVLLGCTYWMGCGSKPTATDPAQDPPPNPIVAETPIADTPVAPVAADPAVDVEVFKYVPTSAEGMFLMRSKQLANRPWVAAMGKHLPPIREWLDESTDYESVLCSFGPLKGEHSEFGPPFNLGTVYTYKSDEAAKSSFEFRTRRGFIQGDGQPPKRHEEQYKGFTIKEGNFNRFCGLSGNVMLDTFNLAFLKAMIEGEGPSDNLQILLDKAGMQNDFVLAVNLTKIPEAVKLFSNEWRDTPSLAAIAPLLEKTQTLSAGVRVEGPTLATARLEMADADSANLMQTVAKEFIPRGRAALLQSFEATFEEEAAAQFRPLVIAAFDGIQVIADGAAVEGSVTAPAEFSQWPAKYAPVLAKIKQDEERQNRLQRIALALLSYHDTFDAFPAPFLRTEDGKPLLSWRVRLLPFIEQQALYDQFKRDEPWHSPHNKPLSDKVIEAFGDDNTTRYQVIVAPGAVFELKEVFDARVQEGFPLRAVTDGAGNTISVVETGADKAVPWAKPDEIVWDGESDPANLFGNLPDNKLWVAFVNGSAHQLDLAKRAEELKLLILRDDGHSYRFDGRR